MLECMFGWTVNRFNSEKALSSTHLMTRSSNIWRPLVTQLNANQILKEDCSQKMIYELKDPPAYTCSDRIDKNDT